ncbi:hypothetical protein LPB72_22535 [Hydrogenophaga crassostreae]|uniref:DUF4124 domain-containing protein n=1 Tax=Hydrogenophaga crassostreae TaxID=1763535 RepID=A0A162YQ60_9BURK|nr:hypothetical protein [Hydrogenophaga crassostreae]AOW11523.1 hypothetical protein LPB072_00260 [Hydrogenophaga crassostreae]OAD39362.1 hypothetical protein LPB72_22535 [Hydrogenophaga crassostreae]
MEQEDPSPFTPPAVSRVPTFLVALGLGAAVFAWWQLKDRWPARETEASAQTATAKPPSRRDTTPSPGVAARSPGQLAAKAEPEPEPSLAWVRCESKGQIVYSDQACEGTGAQKSTSANTRAALSTVHPGSGQKTTATIYRCKGFSGTVFWSSTHCNQKDALIDRVVTVPRGLSLQQQIRVAERSVPRTAPPVAAPSTRRAAQPAASAVSRREVECTTLDESIRQIDARARQPISAPEQDRLRERRRAARDRQFALRC